MSTPIVFDGDPANDDALAILVAAGHPEIDLLAITTVAGHVVSEATARNAAIAAAVAGLTDIPVAAGSERPLVREQLLAAVLDMDRGLDRDRSDLPGTGLDPRHAVDLLIDTFTDNPGATLVMTGPLTNLATALRCHPALTNNIGRVVTLGGAWGLGNKTAAAEFNILCDPEAAAVVYGSSLDLTMIPVDASNHVRITAGLRDRVAALASPPSDFAVELLESLCSTHRPGPGPLAYDQAALHDPCAVLVAAVPGLATSVRARVDVETVSRLTYGRTVVDFAGRSTAPTNADVVVRLDEARIHDEFVSSIARLLPALNSTAQAPHTLQGDIHA